MNPFKQAEIPMQREQALSLLSSDDYFVGVQNIVVARVDVAPYVRGKSTRGRRRTVLSLVGVKAIDQLIEALQAAKAHMEREQALLAQMRREQPWIFEDDTEEVAS